MKIRGKRGTNYTLILYIQNVEKGIIFYEIIEKAVNTDIFYSFLAKVNFPNESKNYLLLDNVRFHHSNKIKEVLAEKNIEPVYLPPYTPELNPTELCFNLIRQKVEKSQPKDLEELKLAINKAIEALQKKDLTKYFNHCLNYDFSQPSTSL